MGSGLSKAGMAALVAVLILFAVGLGWVRHASVKPIVDNETTELKATEREMWDTINSTNGVVASPAPIIFAKRQGGATEDENCCRKTEIGRSGRAGTPAAIRA